MSETNPKFPFYRGMESLNLITKVDSKTTVSKPIQWSTNHLWDIAFDMASEYNDLKNPNHPFDTWFPATTVKENLSSISTYPLETHLSRILFPQRTDNSTIDVSFYDDSHHTLLYFFNDWVRLLTGNGKLVAPIADIVRKLTIVRYHIKDGQKHVDPDNGDSNTYFVFPESTLDFEGASDGGIHEYSMTFHIVGNTTSTRDYTDNFTKFLRT